MQRIDELKALAAQQATTAKYRRRPRVQQHRQPNGSIPSLHESNSQEALFDSGSSLHIIDDRSGARYPISFCDLSVISMSETARSFLTEHVVLPLKFHSLFQGRRRPWKGLLFHGPPGTV
jgi:SpoVK/Ycf46/Vps4 family AAA+-type ATPase